MGSDLFEKCGIREVGTQCQGWVLNNG
jgi:hypothetical protein